MQFIMIEPVTLGLCNQRYYQLRYRGGWSREKQKPHL
jgi:hypothetical protein